MTIRPTLIWLLSALLALALTGSLAPAQETPPPNIIFIVSDDHHWRDYGFMSHPDVQTPHLDRLAERSLRFRRGYVPSSLCCPSLASLITGLSPHQHFITSNDPPGTTEAGRRPGDLIFEQGREEMNRRMDQAPSLPRLLATRGYVSFQSGKWWQGDFARAGFTSGMTKGERHGDDGLQIGRETMQPLWDFMDGARRDKNPFFVWYAPFLPHQPHNPPERLRQKYRHLSSPHVANYYAMIEWLDETCGEIFHYLDRHELTENTLIVYLADNGWIQDPEAPRFAPRSKRSQYDGGLRTPILISWPAHVRPAEAPEPVLSTDIAPTVLQAVGMTPPQVMTGVNLLDASARAARKYICGAVYTHDSQDLDNPAASLRWRWIVSANLKLILPHTANEPHAPVELYDVVHDVDELKNLASSQPDTVKTLTTNLNAWWQP